MMLQCQRCGNVYESSLKRWVGGKCGVAGCEGFLVRYASALDYALVKCMNCGGVFSKDDQRMFCRVCGHYLTDYQ
jgi:predicted  nucleic acid-binding Zn-ribbon protein